jgi:hypothetical protein
MALLRVEGLGALNSTEKAKEFVELVTRDADREFVHEGDNSFLLQELLQAVSAMEARHQEQRSALISKLYDLENCMTIIRNGVNAHYEKVYMKDYSVRLARTMCDYGKDAK